MTKVDDLFDIKNGMSTKDLEIALGPVRDGIPFLRPASTQERTLAGWIARSAVPKGKIFPARTLFVSTNGEGSHTYAYVSSFEFACNSDVSVLVPKREMVVQEKIFHARCITMNRFRFSYGRKPKGDRLKSIPLTDFPAGWLRDIQALKNERLAQLAALDCMPLTFSLGPEEACLVRLDSLFEFHNGHGMDLSSLERVAEGGIRFVSRRKRNNGVSAYIRAVKGVDPFAGGQITCALNGEGGVLYSFLQEEPFYTAYHLAVLRPKEQMTVEELLFYCVCVRANRFRYSYGRQANRTIRSIMVPARASIPRWVYGSLGRAVAGLGIGPLADTRS